MHNRFAEGFVEFHSSGLALDHLSSVIDDRNWLDHDSETLHRSAREARDAALVTAVGEAAASLRGVVQRVFGIAAGAVREWRRRERAASELAALDDHALADLGLSRGDIPFIIAGGAPERDVRGSGAAHPEPANSNTAHRGAA
jgi:uncharacterized protein YjiS (DUF1127 family)